MAMGVPHKYGPPRMGVTYNRKDGIVQGHFQGFLLNLMIFQHQKYLILGSDFFKNFRLFYLHLKKELKWRYAHQL